MNGTLTIGTLDGANIEIREEVGAENFFLFGLTADQVVKRKAEGYHPAAYYHGDMELKAAIDLINSGLFSHGDIELFRPLTDHLLYHDEYLLMADYRAYVDCQQEVDHAYRDPTHWTRMSILKFVTRFKSSTFGLEIDKFSNPGVTIFRVFRIASLFGIRLLCISSFCN